MTRPGGGPGGFDVNAMMKQVQQMQAEMTEAQEKLKDEVVEASAGGGMVKVRMSGDIRLLEVDDRPRGDRPRGRRSCSRTWCSRRSTRRSAPPRSWPRSKLGGVSGLGGAGGLGLPGL